MRGKWMWVTLNQENLSVWFVRISRNVFLRVEPAEGYNSYHVLKDRTANQEAAGNLQHCSAFSITTAGSEY